MTQSWTTCRNCGGEYGIHQSETNKCPNGGRDQTGKDREIYLDTTFAPVEIRDEIEALRGRLTIEISEDGYNGDLIRVALLIDGDEISADSIRWKK